LLSNKEKLLENATVSLTEECSALIEDKLLPKLSDPSSFFIPYSVGDVTIRLLNESTAYTPRQSYKEILSVEESTPKKEKECSPKVELKPLLSHLMYEFLDSAHQFPVIMFN